MDVVDVIRSQYQASLAMLRGAFERCPDEVWDDPGCGNRFWHIAYHSLFYTHLYLQVRAEEFTAWEKHLEEYQFMGKIPFPPHRAPNIGDAYSKEDVLEYCTF